MSVNSIPQAGQARTPRAILMVGGTAIPWLSFEMQHNGIYEAGSLSLKMAVPFAQWPFWTQQSEIVVDVYIGFPGDPMHYTTADLTLMMTARMDEFKLDPASSLVSLSGRDLTSLFIDNKIDGTYQNMTASAVVAQLASKFSVLQQNITATSGWIGNYLKQDNVQIQNSTSMWKLMTYLAQHEGLQCFVLGRTLYFGDFGTAVSDAPYRIVYQPPGPDNAVPAINALRLDFSHDMSIAGDVTVRVRSYHGAQNAAYSYTAKSARTQKNIEKSMKTVQTAQEYDYVFPGLTQQQVQQQAETLLQQIGQHEYKLEATVPGDLATFPWTPVTVEGTGTDFDATYRIARISRTFDRNGYSMSISARTAPNTVEVKLS